MIRTNQFVRITITQPGGVIMKTSLLTTTQLFGTRASVINL